MMESCKMVMLFYGVQQMFVYTDTERYWFGASERAAVTHSHGASLEKKQYNSCTFSLRCSSDLFIAEYVARVKSTVHNM